jgi:CRP-like cAMP-binding protein
MSQVRKEEHRGNRLLAALAADDFARLEPHLEVVTLPRGKVLYDTGDIVQHAYFPHDAVVSLIAVMQDGGLVEMGVFGREGVFGLVSAFVSRESLGRYMVQIPGCASRIASERLNEAVEASPPVRQLIRRHIEALLAKTFQTVACNAVHSVDARCCRWILSTHDRVDQDTLPLTHEFLAEMLGVQRSTVSIIARTLQTAGLIAQSRGVITVVDRAGLEDAACECYGIIRAHYDRLLPGTHAPPRDGRTRVGA